MKGKLKILNAWKVYALGSLLGFSLNLTFLKALNGFPKGYVAFSNAFAIWDDLFVIKFSACP